MEDVLSRDKLSSKNTKKLNSDTALGHLILKKISNKKNNNLLPPQEKILIQRRSNSNKLLNKFNINSTFEEKKKDLYFIKKMNSASVIDRSKIRNIQEIDQSKNDSKNFPNFCNISQINIENVYSEDKKKVKA